MFLFARKSWLTMFATHSIQIRARLDAVPIRSPWYRSPATLSRLIRQRDWPWYRQIHNGRTMVLMMMMMLLLMMRLMLRGVVICADNPWMESLLLRMLQGQTPQVRLLMLLLLLPHAVHFEVHLSINKFKLSPKSLFSKGEKEFLHSSACTKYVRPSY